MIRPYIPTNVSCGSIMISKLGSHVIKSAGAILFNTYTINIQTERVYWVAI